MKKFVGIVISLILGCVAINAAPLQLHLNAGESYQYEVSYREYLIVDYEKSDTSSVGINYMLKLQVDDANADDYMLTAQLDQLKFINYLPSGTMESSSERVSQYDLIATILSEIKKGTFQINIDKYGKIKEVAGLDKVISDAVLKVPNLMEVQQNQFISLMSQYFGVEPTTRNMELVTNIFPESEMELNAIWMNNRSTLLSDAKALDLQYKWVGENKSSLQFAGTGHVVQEGNDEAKFILKGDFNSTINVDIKSGWVISAELNQKMSGNVEMQLEGKTENVPTIMSCEIQIKGIESL